MSYRDVENGKKARSGEVQANALLIGHGNVIRERNPEERRFGTMTESDSARAFRIAVQAEISQRRKENAAMKKKSLEEICVPIFNAEMGARFKLMRMRNLWDQKQLGQKLALPQKTISELETGKIAIPRFTFTIAKLREIFGEDTNFILFGSSAGRFDASAIQAKFFEAKYHTERKPMVKREHWTYKELRVGRKVRHD